MSLINKKIVRQIRDILPVYRYNILQEFYKACKEKHSVYVKKLLIDAFTKYNYCDLYKYEKFLINNRYITAYKNNKYGDDFDYFIDTYVEFINEDNNKLTDIIITNNYMNFIINVYYYNKVNINLYEDSLMSDLFYIEYCGENSIIQHDNINYGKILINEINIKNPEFFFIKMMILLISPSENKKRIESVNNILSNLTQDKIDIICYMQHGINRITSLINYSMNISYYNMFHFFLYHFMGEEDDDVRMLLYIGYYLNKLNILKLDIITKEYIDMISNLNYEFNRKDKTLAKTVYKYFNDYFNFYLFEYYKVIDKILENKKDV